MTHRRLPFGFGTLIKGLGWFSIGLGMAELIAPRGVSRAAGMHKHPLLLQSYGMREITTGLGLLLSRNPWPWLLGRVAGDALDIATVAATVDTRKQGRVGASFAALLGVALLDLYAALRSAPQQTVPNVIGSFKNYRKRSGFPRPVSEMRGAAKNRAQTEQGRFRAAI